MNNDYFFVVATVSSNQELAQLKAIEKVAIVGMRSRYLGSLTHTKTYIRKWKEYKKKVKQ